MRNSMKRGVLAIGLAFLSSFCSSPASGAQAARATAAAPAKEATTGGTAVHAATNESASGAAKSLAETISFRFDIAKLMTNHQFEGQLNSFHVEYEYAGTLAGGGFDPNGHAVPANIFPYFQLVRDDIIQFAKDYADKSDFYEVFGTNICRFIMRKYPQIRKMTLVIDIPAYKDVDVDRGTTIVVVRHAQNSSKIQ
jgi:hypothetical protein